MVNSVVIMWILFSILVAFLPTTAFAYMDPGTGSLFLQLFLGGLAGLAVAIKVYWKKVKAFFKR